MKKKEKRNKAYPGHGEIRCHCGCRTMLRDAKEVCPDAREGAKAYVCVRYPACNSYVMARPDTLEPMGCLAGPELRRLRQEAHRSFNQIYLSGLMSKKKAYQWLAHIVQAPMAHAHIAHLNDYYCEVVIRESKKLLENRRQKTSQLKKASGGEHYAAAH